MEYLSEKNWIEKSKAFIYAEWSKFDIHELQIFETYLSRINPRDPESSCVRFSKREYAEMMGYASHKSLKTRTLEKWVKEFMTKQVTIIMAPDDKRLVNLFSDARLHIDKETGEAVVDLDCNYKLRSVFFDIAKNGYISYRRRNTINFKSEYTLKLYCMLKDHAWGNYEWQVEVKELRGMLGATDALYEKFPEFNRRILKKAQEEINGHTDIRFDYEKITRGRLTRAIKFKIENEQDDVDVIPGQMNVYDYPELLPDGDDGEPEDPAMKKYAFWSEACDHEFSTSQIKELSFLAKPHMEFTFDKDEYDLRIYDFLKKKYISLDNRKVTKSRYGMMKFIVENDC